MKREQFCPRCGRTEKEVRFIEGFCRDCYLKEHSLLKLPNKITVTKCPHCLRLMFKGRQVDDTESSLEEIIKSEARELNDFNALHSEVEFFREREYRKARLKVTGTIKGTKTEAEEVVTIEENSSACDDCNRIAGRYYEAILQVRFDEDSKKNPDKVLEHVSKRLDEMRAKGERLAAITQVQRLKNGFDLFIGSKSAARKIADEISMDRKFTTASTIAGLRDGQIMYRMTYCVRI